MADRTWTQVNVNDEGVSVTVYEEDDVGNPPKVIDEFWMTHDEMKDPSNHGGYTLE